MKKLIFWLARIFDVCVEREVIKEVVVEKVVVKDRYLGGTIDGDVVVNGNLLVRGSLEVRGGVTIKKEV